MRRGGGGHILLWRWGIVDGQKIWTRKNEFVIREGAKIISILKKKAFVVFFSSLVNPFLINLSSFIAASCLRQFDNYGTSSNPALTA